MTIYRKIGGTWTDIDAPARKVSGVWKTASEVYVKDGGAWKLVYQGDVTPPDPPEIILDNINNKYISVGVRLTDPDPDTTLRRIRVLASFKTETYPATQYSSGFYSDSDTIGGPEPWSDWFYNVPYQGLQGVDVTPTRTSNVISYKKFAPTYYAGKTLAANTRYNFRAWAEDIYGNWSLSASAYIITPKKFTSDTKTTRTAVILPERIGTLDFSSGVFTEGEARVQGKDKIASFDYGSRVKDLVGDKATGITINMRLHRASSPQDPFAASHRTWGSRASTNITEYLEAGSLFNRGGSANLNAMSKGQVVYKLLPSEWINNVASGIRGINLIQHPTYKDATQAVFVSQAADPNQGALTVRWQE